MIFFLWYFTFTVGWGRVSLFSSSRLASTHWDDRTLQNNHWFLNQFKWTIGKCYRCLIVISNFLITLGRWRSVLIGIIKRLHYERRERKSECPCFSNSHTIDCFLNVDSFYVCFDALQKCTVRTFWALWITVYNFGGK